MASAAPTRELRLELSDVHFRYHANAPYAVAGVSLRVQAGEVLGLLGPNGAGKSSLMRLMSGLRAPERGSVQRPAAPAFALVPQEYAFYPMLTCLENLQFFAAMSRVAPAARAQRVEEALTQAGLQSAAKQLASQCSGGIKRRLNVAIGLLAQPQLLLLDEPTANVDPQSRAFLLDLVRTLCTRGTAVVYTSHYMDEVQAICDRVAIIDAGRIIAAGTMDELLGHAERHLRVRLSAAPMLESNMLPWTGEGAQWWSVALPPEFSVAKALAQLEHAGAAIVNVQLGDRHLEDVFLRLTRRSLRD